MRKLIDEIISSQTVELDKLKINMKIQLAVLKKNVSSYKAEAASNGSREQGAAK